MRYVIGGRNIVIIIIVYLYYSTREYIKKIGKVYMTSKISRYT